MKLSNRLVIFAIFLTALVYFSPIWRQGLLPFPGHLLVSYFSPWKDQIWEGYPAGVPRKDLLGFDVVRMMGPWRHFVTAQLKKGDLPGWNPHQFAGAPMLSNSQSAVWFPFNWLYLLAPFEMVWTLLVVSQPLLAAGTMFLLLRSKGASKLSSVVVALAYGFSGWMSAWIEWNIHGFVYALLPLALFSIHKQKAVLSILVTSAIIFAGHPQMALMAIAASWLWSASQQKSRWFIKILFISMIVTSVQWCPTLKYFRQASRQEPSSEFVYKKTLLPWRQLPQLMAPNFWGNPATGNFSGQHNFVETTAYTGVALIGLALMGLAAKSRKLTVNSKKFALLLLGLVMVLSLPNPVSLLIGRLNLPIFSTSVASRWLVLWPLGISLLAAQGIDYFIRLKNKSGLRSVMVLGVVFLGLWIWALVGKTPVHHVARRNLIIPTGIAFLFYGSVLLVTLKRTVLARTVLNRLLLLVIFLATMFELIRFGHKTMTYTESQFIYPTTPVIEKLQELSKDYSRFASTEGSVIESNFATRYGLYDLAGYDALYPRRIGELVWAAHHDSQPVKDFSRSTVVTPTEPTDVRNRLWNLGGVRWIVHKDDQLGFHPGHNTALFPEDKFKLVWEGDKWQIYENLEVFPRAFYFSSADWLGEGDEVIHQTLTTFTPNNFPEPLVPAQIDSYQAGAVTISVEAPKDGYLILTDTFYPGWRATVDGEPTEIIPALHAFRAVPVTSGSHIIEFEF